MAPSPSTRRAPRRRSRDLAREMADADGLPLPDGSGAAAAVDRLSCRRRTSATATATTCSPPRRGSRASSPSPRATRRPSTGSGSAEPRPRWSGAAALVSWSGSMFEYLMPSLVMRAPAGSLLETTNRLIVRRQIELRQPSWASRGGFRSPPTTPATSSSPTSTPISACPASA